MSHFAVLVVGENPEFELAPFHEFECTGKDDEFIQSVDKTNELRAEFEEGTTVQIRDPEGNLHCPYSERFFRTPTEGERKIIGPLAGTGCGGGGLSWKSKDWGDGLGHSTRVRFVPEGWIEVEVPRKDVESFTKFLEEWHGYKLTTPTELDLTNEHKYGYALLGSSGEVVQVIDRTNPNAKWDWWVKGGRYADRLPLKTGGFADTAKKGDVDFTQPFSVFAFVKGRQWQERGKMGWWACVSNEKDQADWDAILRDFISSLSDDETLTVVDCHI